MIKMHNKKTKVKGIKTIICKNYNLPKDIIDFEHIIDSKLSYIENWNEVYDKCKLLISQEKKMKLK